MYHRYPQGVKERVDARIDIASGQGLCLGQGSFRQENMLILIGLLQLIAEMPLKAMSDGSQRSEYLQQLPEFIDILFAPIVTAGFFVTVDHFQRLCPSSKLSL